MTEIRLSASEEEASEEELQPTMSTVYPKFGSLQRGKLLQSLLGLLYRMHWVEQLFFLVVPAFLDSNLVRRQLCSQKNFSTILSIPGKQIFSRSRRFVSSIPWWPMSATSIAPPLDTVSSFFTSLYFCVSALVHWSVSMIAQGLHRLASSFAVLY